MVNDDDLIEFLRAQWDEDEQTANAAAGAPPMRMILARAAGKDASHRHIARHDPARVRADVEAKRLVLDMYENACHRAAHGPNADAVAAARVARSTLRGVLAALTLPYADHPDFRKEWAL